MVTEIINNALIKVTEYEVRNPRTYVAHRSKVRLAKRCGEKDVDPLFKLPRIPVEAVKDLADELSEFELPARQLDAEIIDEFHSQNSEINHRGRDHRSSISSNPPIIPRSVSGSSISASSEDSEDGLFQSFVQSPGSARSSSSSPEQLFQNHFQAQDQDEPQDETIQEALREDREITGSAASLLPEPEPVKTPEPRRPRTEVSDKTVRRDDDPTVMNTPTREQESQRTSSGGEIPAGINSPPERILKLQYQVRWMAAVLLKIPGEDPAEYQFLQTDMLQNSSDQKVSSQRKEQSRLLRETLRQHSRRAGHRDQILQLP